MRIGSRQVPLTRGVSGASPSAPQEGCGGDSLMDVVKTDALKVIRGGAGLVGATVGGALGLIPGVGYGISRGLSEEPGWDVGSRHMAACDVGDYWGISYGVGASTLAGFGTFLATGNKATSILAAAAAGVAGVTLQYAFRSLTTTGARLPYDTETFPSNIGFCADKEMARSITNPLNGALIGVREGARQGKLAFQDLVVPSMRPSQWTPYKS